MLLDLVDSKPKDLAHTIREFASRTAMFRDCRFCHIGDLLVSMLAASAHSDSEHAPSVVAQVAAQDPASVTAEQAATIGRMLATKTRSFQPQSAALKLNQAVGMNSVLITMKSQHVWFVPMLEVLLVPPDYADSRRPSIRRRLTAIVTPHAMRDGLSDTNFDSVVRTRSPRLAITSHPDQIEGTFAGARADPSISRCKRSSECLRGAPAPPPECER
jgi:hypothetical protein